MKRFWCGEMFLWIFTVLGAFYAVYAVKNETFCEHKSELSYVTCTGNITNLSGLEQEIKNLVKPVTIFHLYNVTIDTLPPGLFYSENTRVHTIIFDTVLMKLLSVSVLGGSAFATLGETLERLEIYSSKGVFGWDWGVFHVLKKLEAIIVENSDVIFVRKSICSAPDLRLIQLNDAIINYVDLTAFKKCANLTFISLSKNGIKSIARSMFPRPAKRLWSIDISFNELTKLEHDVFEDMTALHELKLDHNMLKHLSYQTLAPVWKNLNQLWLQDNELKCESLCWTQGSVQHPLFFDSTICQGNSTKWMLFKYFEYSDGCLGPKTAKKQ